MVLPNTLGGLVSIHVRHVAVHQNQIIVTELVFIELWVLDHFIESLLPVVSAVTNLPTVLQFYRVLQNYLHRVNVEILIVDNQNSSAREWRKVIHCLKFSTVHIFDKFLVFKIVRRVYLLLLDLFKWFFNSLFYSTLSNLLKLERKDEGRSFVFLRFEMNFAIKFFNDQLGNHESKPYAVNVHLLFVLNESKKLKKFVLILLSDPNSGVYHRDLQVLILIIV